MSDTIHKALVALKDVKGIEGSFLLNAEGALVAMEMPSLFDQALFAEVGPRIERLADSFSSFGDEFESCVIRFADHMLCVKQFEKGGALCILTNGAVNLPALKMAINLTHRRLADEIATAKPLAGAAPAAAAPAAAPEAEPAKTAAPPSPPPPAEAEAVAEARPAPVQRAPRYYRGALVVD